MKHLTRGEDSLASHPGFHLVGRDRELAALSAILMRDRANSVLLNGPPGAGCTSLCLGLVALKAKKNAPYDIVGKRIFWLDVDGLFSSGDTATISADFAKIMGMLELTSESILIIEDMGDFLAAARSAGCSHFLNALFSSIKRGKTQVIIETHDGDLEATLLCHSDASELLTLMYLTEPKGADLRSIVKANVDRLLGHHGIQVDGAAIDKAIELTIKYRNRLGSSRAQPDASVSLLDRSMSSYRREAHSNAATDEIRAVSLSLQEAESLHTEMSERLTAENLRAQNAAEKATAKVSAVNRLAAGGGIETDEATRLRTIIKDAQVGIDTLRSQYQVLRKQINDKLLLTSEIVVAEFAEISGIPAAKLSQDERAKLVNLASSLKADIFGQDAIVDHVASGVKTAKIGRRNKDAPLGAWMLLGPSGTGKTQLAKALSKGLFDDEKALGRFDMSEYMEKHAVAKLIGAPPGYEGFEAGGILTNSVRNNPYQVLLFDETEKAHPDVFNVFLQILSDGRLTDNVGRVVSFADCFIIMTTNVGQDQLLDEALTPDERRDGALEILSQTYRSEFLNRFAGRRDILCFGRLPLDAIEKIVRRELASITDAYRDEVDFSVSDVAGAIARDHYDPKIGARGIPGFLKTTTESRIVDAILENKGGAKIKLLIGYDQGTKSMSVEVAP